MVPKGAEFRAISRGLRRIHRSELKLLAIPAGPNAVTQYLQQWKHEAMQASPAPQVLVMGLCGSLRPQHRMGDVVSYQGCIDGCSRPFVSPLTCHPTVVSHLKQVLSSAAASVTAVTCDHVIHGAAEKQQLAKTYSADVVDMEGFAILKTLNALNIPVAMVRVVSDDAVHDLPNLTNAFTSEGTLRPLPLALGMVQQPRAAIRLIQGSLRGLKILEDLTTQLFLT